jgi:uncharacterized protein YjdB
MKTRILFGALLLVAACESSTENDDVAGVVTITPPTASIVVGQTVQLRAAVSEFSGDTTVQWLTLDGHIASVNASGLVSGLAPGVADIVARVKSANSVRSTARVTVSGAGEQRGTTARDSRK